jgi:hypothetical protein
MKKLNNFLSKAKVIHGDKYDYSLVDYTNNKSGVTIVCPIHGDFKQTPDKHINAKQGCPRCSPNHKLTLNDFIKISNSTHNNTYDYSKSIYINANTNIEIICSKHGPYYQRASVHMSGGGCPKCIGWNKNNDDVIQSLIEIHGDKYDYSKSKYINANSPIRINCKEHGIFEQTYNTHKNGHGCPKCAGRNKTTHDFIEQSKIIHGDKYDYGQINYSKSSDKILITCLIHGNFRQTPANHLQGQGCPKCKGVSIIEKKTKTKEQFIEEAKIIHGDKYDYSNIEYIHCKNKIKIMCSLHGYFEQVPDSHLQGCGCPKCGLTFDKLEGQIREFITNLDIKIIEKDRNIINPLELDIFIPTHNIAIELNGVYWHSELYKPSNYHLNKTELCEEKNIKLIHIFDDEWLYKKDIVKSRLKNILGLTKNKIYARKCEIRVVSSKISKDFLDKNHIQGNVNSSIRLGLYYDEELVSLMTFGKGRIAMGGNSKQYELVRFCNKLDTSVIGGADKLLKNFIKSYQPKEIISYADRRWSQGDLYEKLNFTKTHNSKPNYWYIINNKRTHRFSYRKSMLIKQGFNTNKTEHQIMLDRKIYRIYDCGTIVYKKTLD